MKNHTVRKASDRAARTYSGGQFWNITRLLGIEFAHKKMVGDNLYSSGTGKVVAWTSLFRKLGYSGFVDYGDGLIHQSEKMQAVIVDFKSIKILEKIKNYVPVPSSDVDEKLANIKLARELSEKELLKKIKEYNGSFIQYIKNPSEKLQLAAVRSTINKSEIAYIGAKSIKYIRNPTEKVQIEAVKIDPDTIKYIKNPSEEIQKMVVQKEPYNISHIQNPSEETKLIAVQNCPSCIVSIKNPSIQLQELAIQKDPYNIKYIQNPDFSIQKQVIEKHPEYIQYIKQPDPRILAYVQQKIDSMKYKGAK